MSGLCAAPYRGSSAVCLGKACCVSVLLPRGAVLVEECGTGRGQVQCVCTGLHPGAALVLTLCARPVLSAGLLGVPPVVALFCAATCPLLRLLYHLSQTSL